MEQVLTSKIFIWTPVSNRWKILEKLLYLVLHGLETGAGNFLDSSIHFEKILETDVQIKSDAGSQTFWKPDPNKLDADIHFFGYWPSIQVKRKPVAKWNRY